MLIEKEREKGETMRARGKRGETLSHTATISRISAFCSVPLSHARHKGIFTIPRPTESGEVTQRYWRCRVVSFNDLEELNADKFPTIFLFAFLCRVRIGPWEVSLFVKKERHFSKAMWIKNNTKNLIWRIKSFKSSEKCTICEMNNSLNIYDIHISYDFGLK